MNRLFTSLENLVSSFFFVSSFSVMRSLIFSICLLVIIAASHAYAAQVTLTWQDPNNNSADVGGYKLYYWRAGQNPSVVDTGKTSTYVLTGLNSGATYHFAVTAHDGTGGRESAFSNEITYTVPDVQPPNVTFDAAPKTLLEGDAATLSWTTTNATSVAINHGVGSNLATTGSKAVTPTATTAYTLTATGPGGTVTRQVTVTVTPRPVEDPFIQERGSDGLVVFDAENPHSVIDQGSHRWDPISRNDAAEGGAMKARPNVGTNNDTNYTTRSPRLDFQVQFVQTGTHYVWVRGLGPNGGDDSIHVGLDGQAVSSSDRISGFRADWTWSNSTMDGPVATIQISSTGLHTINVWMREDGFRFDKLVLTTNANYIPNGMGPSGQQFDSDDDGFADALELHYGADPLNPDSRPLLTDLIQVGNVKADHRWQHVAFSTPFLDPVIVARSLSSRGNAPAIVRVQNVTPNGFDLRVQEWDYLNGKHATEIVGYMAMERGHFTLDDGSADGIQVEAGSFDTDQTSFTSVSFAQAFRVAPVVVAAISSANEMDAVTGRLRNISPTAFRFRLQEQEKNPQMHALETVGYIAWEPSSGSLDGMTFDVDATPNAVTHQYYPVEFNALFDEVPVCVADMQTTDGWDTANLRWQNKGRSSFDIRVAEEQSEDDEIYHTTEVVGYIAIR